MHGASDGCMPFLRGRSGQPCPRRGWVGRCPVVRPGDGTFLCVLGQRANAPDLEGRGSSVPGVQPCAFPEGVGTAGLGPGSLAGGCYTSLRSASLGTSVDGQCGQCWGLGLCPPSDSQLPPPSDWPGPEPPSCLGSQRRPRILEGADAGVMVGAVRALPLRSGGQRSCARGSFLCSCPPPGPGVQGEQEGCARPLWGSGPGAVGAPW